LSENVGIDLALDLGCYDEVEALVREACKRYPGYNAKFFATSLARVAYLKGDKEEAVRRCYSLLRQFPSAGVGYHLAADYLGALGRHDEADAVIARGASKLTTDFTIQARHATRAMRREAWPEALQRWELMRGRFDDIAVPLGIARCLREMDRLVEAGHVLAEAGVRYKPNDDLFAELANLATAKGNFDEVVRAWQDAIRWNPFSASAYAKGAAALRKAGQDEAAEELLQTAITMCRKDLTVHLEYARCADRRRDWGTAKERWAIVCERFPECTEARRRQAEASAAITS
jgi:tetratricopeptide (TPR) repeat protein